MGIKDDFKSSLNLSEEAPEVNLATSTTIPLRQTEAVQREVVRNKPTQGEQFSAARELDSTASNFATLNYMGDFEVDDTYTGANEDEIAELYDSGIPDNVVEDMVFNSRSQGHFDARKSLVKRELENEKVLANSGVMGTVNRIGVNLIDEGAIALAVATTPATSAALKFSRLKRMLTSGAVIAGENAALESVLVSASETRGREDVLYAAIAGFALGAPLSYLSRGENDEMLKAVSSMSKGIDKDVARKAGLEVAEDDLQDSAGAMRATNQPYQLDEAGYPTNNSEDITAMGSARYDVVGAGKSSPMPEERKLIGDLAEDSVGNVDHSVNQVSASEIATRNRYQLEDMFRRQSEFAFEAWRKQRGYGFVRKHMKRGEFYDEVGKHIRNGGSTDPHVIKAAKGISDTFGETLTRLKKAEVKGFRDIEANGSYLPRIHAFDRIHRLNAVYGEAQMVKLISKAMLSASEELTEEATDKIAKGYYRKLFNVDAGTEAQFGRMFDTDNEDYLRGLLKEESGLDESEIENILFKAINQDKGKPTGVISRAKRRLEVNEGFKMRLKNQETLEMDDVGFEDMLEHNAERLIGTYLHQTTGWLGLAAKGIKSKADFNARKRRMEKQASTMGFTKPEGITGKSKLDQANERADFLFNSITGVPLENDPRGLFQSIGRTVRDINFVTMMNQVGFAQIAEFGNMLGLAGIRATLRHVPEIGKTLSRIKDTGNIGDDLAAQLEAITGLGGERMRRTAVTRYDDFGSEQRADGGIFGKVNDVLQVGKMVTGDISGMSGVTVMLHRMAAKGIAQQFLDMATGAKKINMKRMAAYGLSDDHLQRIFTMMRTHSKEVDSTIKKGMKLKTINIEDWTDQGAASAFADSMFRMGRHVIQENDVGNTAMLMHSSVGKMLIQFRTFMAVAHSKQLLHNLHMRDMDTAMAFSLSMMFASTAYVAQQTINAQGRPDKKKFLEERLSEKEIAKASFQRAGFASVIPAVLDSALYLGGQDPYFQYGRTTDLASGGLLSNPSISTANKVGGVVRGTVGAATNPEFKYSQKNWRDFKGIIPFGNSVGIKNALEAIGSGLPARTSSDTK